MLTIIACPKPFRDPHIDLIQRNAISSWLRLEPRPHIILFGDEFGTAEVARELGVSHMPQVARNALGTPLVSDIFRRAAEVSPDKIVCFVNSDIILMSDFIRAVRTCSTLKRSWLFGGRPWDMSILDPLSFEAGWEDQLKQRLPTDAKLRVVNACDYFVFPKNLWGELPPFAVGRCYFDNALLYRARAAGVMLIDATPSVMAVHQAHGYPTNLGGEWYLTNPEACENVRLAGGPANLHTWDQATYRITDGRVRRYWRGKHWRITAALRPVVASMEEMCDKTWYGALKLTKPIRRPIGVDRDMIVRVLANFRR